MPGHDGAYASFVITHEARLVRSLMSETGLSRRAASTVAATVLPAAHARGFATDGAAYGWLRVAARHLAADSPGWSAAADAALARADLAAAALADLPAEDRELLRLRYVEGLLPDAVAARLGTTVGDVLAGLERVRAAATRSLPAPRRPLAVPLPRVAAALAAAAAVVALSLGGSSPSTRLPAFAGSDPSIADVFRPVTGREPVPAHSAGDTVVRPASTGFAPAVGTARPGGDDSRSGACTSCTGRNLTDKLVVAVPAGLGEVVGEDELELEQQAGEGQFSLCSTLPEPPEGVARCVRGGHLAT